MLCEQDLPTPSLVVDETILERNLERMASYAHDHGLKLRPHSKTHKSIEIGRRQMRHGAIGLTVAKAGEAEVMAEVCDDLLVGYPTVDQHRAAKIADLAGRRTVRVAVDSTLAADVLSHAASQASSTIGILVELDVGFHRTGVQDAKAAVDLAGRIANLPGIRFDGLFIYPGHVTGSDPVTGMHSVSGIVSEAVDVLKRSGFPVLIVSGGSTPTALQSHLVTHLTEFRPGTYVFNDWNSVSVGCCTSDECAARMLCTVISDAVPGKVVIDAGSKALSSDRLISDPVHGGYGSAADYPQARIVRLSEEHGEVDVSRCSKLPALGERIWLIPNHICPCVNLQNRMWLKHADGSLEELPIDARGMLV